MMKLNDYLDEYKLVTIRLISSIDEEKDLDQFFNKRQEIINLISSLNFTKEDFQQINMATEILELEKQLQDKISKEQEETRKKINKLKLMREARIKYENSQFTPTFFNKKI